MPTPQQLFGPAPASRETWSTALLNLVAPATRVAALGPGRLPVHPSSNDHAATWFELVARPLWGLDAHAAGGLTGAEQHWDELRFALTAAVDPGHPWYIGTPDGIDQRLVESAAVGYALAAAPREMWDPLPGRQREHLINWLSAAADAPPCDNNWCFFPVLAAAGLRAVGVPPNEAQVTAPLDRIEDFALGDGWYADGPGTAGQPGARDYYIAFGFHFYGLLLASLKAVDDDRAGRYRERASDFAAQFQHWFAADGAALPFGRSLGYRFAQASFWSMLAAADVPALGWADVRGLAERNMRWWWQQPILGEHGELTVGYAYPNTGVVEQYLAAGSPYWGTKVFAALAAQPSHPFWTQQPAQPPARETVSIQPAPCMVLTRDCNGDVTALAGQNAPAWRPRGAAAKYAKFAYSTLAGFSVPGGEPTLEEGGFDSTLALSDDGERWRTRCAGESKVDGHSVVLRWQPWPDVSIETRLTPDGNGHRREHRIVTERRLHTAEGGFSVPHRARGQQPGDVVARAGLASAATGGIVSEIVCGAQREGQILIPLPGTHLLYPRTVLPMLRATLEPGEHHLRCHVGITRTRSAPTGCRTQDDKETVRCKPLVQVPSLNGRSRPCQSCASRRAL